MKTGGYRRSMTEWKHRNGKIIFNWACRTYGIPKPKLRLHFTGSNKKKIERPNGMTTKMEEELAQHVIIWNPVFLLTILKNESLSFNLLNNISYFIACTGKRNSCQKLVL